MGIRRIIDAYFMAPWGRIHPDFFQKTDRQVVAAHGTPTYKFVNTKQQLNKIDIAEGSRLDGKQWVLMQDWASDRSEKEGINNM
ncbi:MAG: hypothetical protein M1820_009739 [Bogoriella megaspora]|nr:MAG: hypothetical protein M1820_009739 [Bogoriella megaspora]